MQKRLFFLPEEAARPPKHCLRIVWGKRIPYLLSIRFILSLLPEKAALRRNGMHRSPAKGRWIRCATLRLKNDAEFHTYLCRVALNCVFNGTICR